MALVTPPKAETTITCLMLLDWTISNTLLIDAWSATDVPPNFATIMNLTFPMQHAALWRIELLRLRNLQKYHF